MVVPLVLGGQNFDKNGLDTLCVATCGTLWLCGAIVSLFMNYLSLQTIVNSKYIAVLSFIFLKPVLMVM